MTIPWDDQYLTEQGQALGVALADAVKTGDVAPALKIADHLVAEAGISRDQVLGVVLFNLSVRSSAAGDLVAAEAYQGLLKTLISTDTQKTLVVASLTQGGLGQGWLPAEQFDRLAELAAELDLDKRGDVLAALDKIERRA